MVVKSTRMPPSAALAMSVHTNNDVNPIIPAVARTPDRLLNMQPMQDDLAWLANLVFLYLRKISMEISLQAPRGMYSLACPFSASISRCSWDRYFARARSRWTRTRCDPRQLLVRAT